MIALFWILFGVYCFCGMLFAMFLLVEEREVTDWKTAGWAMGPVGLILYGLFKFYSKISEDSTE